MPPRRAGLERGIDIAGMVRRFNPQRRIDEKLVVERQHRETFGQSAPLRVKVDWLRDKRQRQQLGKARRRTRHVRNAKQAAEKKRLSSRGPTVAEAQPAPDLAARG